ncbi:MAG: transposase domain-containing protein, partial [Deltaproteobacteria bacterium]|nr:transposase domain-containing protein [Deltaproteobacteria bacterium]MCP4501706.1 transposase domain-containing protein [Deltaproteobacteria bacterium]
IETCKRCGVNPWAYLKDVLWKLQAESWPTSRIDELLPPNWNSPD